MSKREYKITRYNQRVVMEKVINKLSKTTKNFKLESIFDHGIDHQTGEENGYLLTVSYEIEEDLAHYD